MTHERLLRFARREVFFLGAIVCAIWFTKAPDGWQHNVSIWLTVILSAIYLRPRPRPRPGDEDGPGAPGR